MDIMHGSCVVGNGHLRMIGGRQAVGSAGIEVVVDVAWTEHSKNRRVVSGSMYLFVGKDREVAELTMRGRFIDAVVGRTSCLAFKGLIGFPGLEELERLRSGNDLEIKTRFALLTDDGLSTRNGLEVVANPGARLLEDWDGDSLIRIPAADWLKVLENVGYRSSLLLEVIYPYDRAEQDSLTRYIRKARDAFDGGRYDECVAQIRHILEEIDDRRGDKEKAGKAIGKYRGTPDERRRMTLEERLLALRKTLEHVSHTTHHKGDDVVTRSSAKAMLIVAAAMLELFPEPAV